MRMSRAEEIDYYEELGVERNATPEAIRDSFRALVRLLHPDQQTDQHLKAAAEKQLRKMNRIYAVLSDPARRREYDEALDFVSTPPDTHFHPRARNITANALVARMVWVAVALLGVAIVIWLATDPPSNPVGSERAAVPAAPKPSAPQTTRPIQESSPAGAPAPAEVSPKELAQLKAELRLARQERDQAQRALAALEATHTGIRQSPSDVNPTGRNVMPPSSPPRATVSTSMAELAPPRIVPANPGQTLGSAAANPAFRSFKPPGSDPHQFAGFWFFARSSQKPQAGSVYPPEFIEAVLTEENGVVHGKYRSRYRIVDRAISPDVNFEFTGSPSGAAMNCAWLGPGGAKGRLTLRLTDEYSMKVDWTASEVGTVQGLASGTATLTRRLE
jgi:curved DNA-binding protein CbpA